MQPNPASLSPTLLIDSDNPDVIAFAQRHAVGANDRERAVALYYAVRDRFRYDPYKVDLSVAGMRASGVLEKNVGWCVPKAALLAAACRAVGIPARVGYADVRNHLSTARLRETLQTDLFIWHGYTDIWITSGIDSGQGGAWVKATPAFNIELCERFGLLPLEFDGRSDSIYHPFDRAGNQHMEYVHQRGAFDDMPLAQMVEDFHNVYPKWMREMGAMQAGDFHAEAAAERGATP